MNKKTLIIWLLAIIIASIAAFLGYKYFFSQKTAEQPNVEIGGIQVNTNGSEGSLTICQDKCGDSVCQQSEAGTCAETKEECPQDCK